MNLVQDERAVSPYRSCRPRGSPARNVRRVVMVSYTVPLPALFNPTHREVPSAPPIPTAKTLHTDSGLTWAEIKHQLVRKPRRILPRTVRVQLPLTDRGKGITRADRLARLAAVEGS